MSLFRIVVGLSSKEAGDIIPEKLISDVAKTFEGFSVTETLGYWKGVPEKSLTFDIATAFTFEWMKRFGEGLAFLYGQESVMVVQVVAEVAFMTPNEYAGGLVDYPSNR